jgi:hypothetical protein
MLLCVLALAVAPTAGQAQVRDSRFCLSAGWFPQSTGARLRVDGAQDIGSEIDLNADLGFKERSNNYLLSAQWRIAARHRLSADYFTTDREAMAAL